MKFNLYDANSHLLIGTIVSTFEYVTRLAEVSPWTDWMFVCECNQCNGVPDEG